eukprot:6579874-Lingulodinium_polyedra.AAC.1
MEASLAFNGAFDLIGRHCRRDQTGLHCALDSPRLDWTPLETRPTWAPLCTWFAQTRLGFTVDWAD